MSKPTHVIIKYTILSERFSTNIMRVDNANNFIKNCKYPARVTEIITLKVEVLKTKTKDEFLQSIKTKE